LKIYFVRHAQTTWHLANKYAGLTDIQLSEVGIDQSISLANWASKQKISVVYTSDLIRAMDTALPLSRAMNLDMVIEPGFREVNFGDVEGLNPQEFKKKFPNVWTKFQYAPATTHLPNGESGAITVSNAESALVKIFNEKKSDEILIVSHGTLIRILLCKLLGLKIDDYRRIFPIIQNTSITSVWIPRDAKSNELFGNCSLLDFNKFYG
jgi:broad specificity phosphatase PhoE